MHPTPGSEDIPTVGGGRHLALVRGRANDIERRMRLKHDDLEVPWAIPASGKGRLQALYLVLVFQGARQPRFVNRHRRKELSSEDAGDGGFDGGDDNRGSGDDGGTDQAIGRPLEPAGTSMAFFRATRRRGST